MLLDKLQQMEAAEEETLPSTTAEEEVLVDQVPNEVGEEQQILERLNALPEDQKGFIAAFMTPEFAQAVGMITGNEQLSQFIQQRADSSRVLLPLPREVAQQLVGQMQGQQTQPSLEQQPQASPSPPPEGVMSPRDAVI